MRWRQSFAIVLVGKRILLREGLARILRSVNFRVLASVSSADDFPQNKLQLHRLLFLIVHTGEDFDAAVEQIELLSDRHPGARIAIVADHYRLGELVSAFRAGANGYLVDVMTCDVFIRSIELVMMGETIFPLAFLSFALDSESEHLCEAMPSDENNKAILVTTDNALAPQRPGVVARYDFLCELRGFPSRTPRLRSFDLADRTKSLEPPNEQRTIAEFAKKPELSAPGRMRSGLDHAFAGHAHCPPCW